MSATPRAPAPPRLPDDLADRPPGPLEDGTVLGGTVLTGDLAGTRCEDVAVERSRISAAALTGSALHRLRLTDVEVEATDLSATDLDGCSFRRVRFRDCRLSAVELARARLVDVTFTGCRLDRANLRMVDATSVTFDGCDLREVDCTGARLTRVRFFDCDLTASEFSSSRLADVRFHGSDLTDLRGGLALGGSTVGTDQVLAVALGVLAAVGIGIDDEREPAAPDGPAPRRPTRRPR